MKSLLYFLLSMISAVALYYFIVHKDDPDNTVNKTINPNQNSVVQTNQLNSQDLKELLDFRTWRNSEGKLIDAKVSSIDFENFREYTYLESLVKQLDIWILPKQLSKLEVEKGRLLEEYNPVNYKQNRKGAEADLYHDWLEKTFSDYLSSLHNLTI